MTTYSKETALYDTGAIKSGIDDAATKADNYLTDVSGGGVMVHPSDDSTSGWKISSALELLKSGISYIWAGLVNNIATVRIGKEAGGHSVIDENGMRVYGDSTGTTQLANIGYGSGRDQGSGTTLAPYYDLGVRRTGAVIGNYSVVEGYNNAAPWYGGHAEGQNTTAGFLSHAEGLDTDAQGYYSHATGRGTISEYAQTVIGEYNQSQGSSQSRSDIDFAFVIGNGTSDDARSNCFAVDWSGNIMSEGVLYSEAISSDLFSIQNVSISASASSTGAIANTKSVSKAGYFPLGVVGTSIETGGAYSRGFYLTNEKVGSCTLNVRLQASSTGTKNCNANILWLKVTA